MVKYEVKLWSKKDIYIYWFIAIGMVLSGIFLFSIVLFPENFVSDRTIDFLFELYVYSFEIGWYFHIISLIVLIKKKSKLLKAEIILFCLFLLATAPFAITLSKSGQFFEIAFLGIFIDIYKIFRFLYMEIFLMRNLI